MNPEIKKILNNLRCPICKAPIDIYKISGYNYCCAINYDHYMVKLLTYDYFSKIEKELVNIYDKNHKYSIEKSYFDNKISTLISVMKTDLENRVIFDFKKKQFSVDRDLFDFSDFKSDKAINKIKTIFIFQ